MGSTSRTGIFFITIQLITVITALEMNKRGPHGFLGVRGKKFESTEQFFKRNPQFFVGVKGKKLYDFMRTPDVAAYYKRVPMGFVGMRGKKDFAEFENVLDAPVYPLKQGSLIGQIDYSNDENKNNFPILNDLLQAYLDKFTLPSTFEPPQSNEGEDERINNEIEKRAASIHQFFGVRGKKSEKRPSDLSFRGKFIGVRGKKDLKNNAAQEIRFLVDNEPLPKRKGQMGFIGMRGKKWSDDSSPEMETPN